MAASRVGMGFQTVKVDAFADYRENMAKILIILIIIIFFWIFFTFFLLFTIAFWLGR